MRRSLALSVAAVLALIAASSTAVAHRLVDSGPPAGNEHPLPSGAVARITPRPISQQLFDHWLAIAVKGRDRSPRASAMSFLIQSAWVELEARDHGISVSRRTVRREFNRQKREAFDNEADYQRFLKSSGFTEQDILYRVKLDLLQSRLRKHAIAGKRSPSAQRRAFARFVRDFERKWRVRTGCAPGYVVSQCARELAVSP